jgi:hypothetical protein
MGASVIGDRLFKRCVAARGSLDHSPPEDVLDTGLAVERMAPARGDRMPADFMNAGVAAM